MMEQILCGPYSYVKFQEERLEQTGARMEILVRRTWYNSVRKTIYCAGSVFCICSTLALYGFHQNLWNAQWLKESYWKSIIYTLGIRLLQANPADWKLNNCYVSWAEMTCFHMCSFLHTGPNALAGSAQPYIYYSGFQLTASWNKSIDHKKRCNQTGLVKGLRHSDEVWHCHWAI